MGMYVMVLCKTVFPYNYPNKIKLQCVCNFMGLSQKPQTSGKVCFNANITPDSQVITDLSTLGLFFILMWS